MSKTNDSVQRFLFEKTAIRGERVYIKHSFAQALASHLYTQPIRVLLGELVAASVLLSTSLKYAGIMTLQVRSTGSLPLLMVECNHKNSFRALARWQGENSHQAEQPMLKDGQLVISIDPEQGKRYQGIVPLNQPTLSKSLEHYFTQSEQLPTYVWLASDGIISSGLLIQQLPHHTNNTLCEAPEEDWSRIIALTSTISDEELLSLNTETLLYRLYHEENVRLFDSQPVTFKCTCSRQRSATIIKNIGQEEALSVLSEQGQIKMDCQFCNQQYIFNAEEIKTIFGCDLTG
ncbi:MAG: Hsp33 family molecular chaperone HslO [Endozoicomonas sp. (ex Botrylloides leachii)]|nr:Hsp33 family molecular chaperone HslO [Endozoicomonas sp. (ex Botrylloides leachii)]